MNIHVNIRYIAPTFFNARDASAPSVLLVMLCLVAATLSTPIVHAESSAEIRLPGLIQRWKQPGEKENPTITLDEIVQCMGTDIGIRERHEAIKKQEAALEIEYAAITAQVPILEKQAAELKSGNEQIKNTMARIESESSKLKVRFNAIESSKKRKLLSPAGIRQLNADIATYNEDAQANNRRQTLLKSTAVEIQAKIDNYNIALAKHNERIALFAEKNALFKVSADQSNMELLAYKNECAGERTLKK